VANYQQHYDSLLLDAGGPAAAAAGAGDDELESVNLLRDDTHHTHRLSFGSDSVCLQRSVIIDTSQHFLLSYMLLISQLHHTAGVV